MGGLQGRETKSKIEQKFPGRDSSTLSNRKVRRARARTPVVEAVELPEPMPQVREEIYWSAWATLVAGAIREGLEQGIFFTDADGVVRCSNAVPVTPAQTEGNS